LSVRNAPASCESRCTDRGPFWGGDFWGFKEHYIRQDLDFTTDSMWPWRKHYGQLYREMCVQVEMTGSSILEYVHRLDQQELVQQFHLTPPDLMTSSPSHLYYSDDECADDSRTTTRGGSLSKGS